MHWLIVGAIAGAGAAALLFAAWWVWWRLPKRQVDKLRLQIRDPKARADVEDNFRKTVGQVLGGTTVLIGAGFGAGFAYLQFSQQQQATHELLISNQVAKGFEQLGSDKVLVRLGGIYALEGVMNTSEQYHQPVLEALSALVRDGTRTATGDGPPTTDIQAALTVIGRRAAIGTGAPNLEDAHIPKANLLDANLSGAYLSGADLRDANLIDANLSGADLFRTDLSGAYLIRADLSDAYLRSPEPRSADPLDDANLTGARLSGAYLIGATISQTQLDKACGERAKLPPGLTLKPCK
jgi:uncharacterized protein YjbI with pentapeptide repeats